MQMHMGVHNSAHPQANSLPISVSVNSKETDSIMKARVYSLNITGQQQYKDKSITAGPNMIHQTTR